MLLKSYLCFFVALLLSINTLFAADSVNVYLFPGQGSDARVFMDLTFPDNYIIQYISYPMPEKRESMTEFASRFSSQIDTTHDFVFIGFSMGGMICSELMYYLNPEKVIIISSAKCNSELPSRYNFMKKVPVNRLVPKLIVKWGALILQPIVEPDRNNNKETFKAMLKAKSPLYLKRTSDMIINWNRQSYSDKIIHIHGDNDHTIPYRNVHCDYTIKDGSHMMVLTRADEINKLINYILEGN